MPIPRPEPITLTGEVLRSVIGKAAQGNVTIVSTPWGDESEYGGSVHIPVRFLAKDQATATPYILVLYANSQSYHMVTNKLGVEEEKWVGAKLALDATESRGRLLVRVLVVEPASVNARLEA